MQVVWKRDFPYILFFMVALLIFWGRWLGRSPFVYLGIDAGRVAMYAAHCDYSQLFVKQARFIGPLCLHPHLVLVNLLRLLENLTGDFGTATVVLLIPVVFAFLTGFYIVGRILFQHSGWATLYAFLQLPVVWMRFPVGSHWGLYEDVWAHHLYEAVLPFFWWLAIRYVDNINMWPWILFANGLAAYLHLRDGITWMWALGLGFLLVLGKYARTWRTRVRVVFLMGIGALFWVIPAIGFYLRPVVYQWMRPVPVSVEDIWRYRQAVVAAPLLFVLYWLLLGHIPVLYTGLVGFHWLKRLSSPRERDLLRMMLGWALAIVMLSFGLNLVPPYLSLEIFRRYFIREAVYLIPLMLTWAMWFYVRCIQVGSVPLAASALASLVVSYGVAVTQPLAHVLEGWDMVTRLVNRFAIAIHLRAMAWGHGSPYVFWIRPPYTQLAVRTALHLGLLCMVLLLMGVIWARLWGRKPWDIRDSIGTFKRAVARSPSLWSSMGLLSMAAIWILAHGNEGSLMLLRKGFLSLGSRPMVAQSELHLYGQAIPSLVPPKVRVFTPDPYPWEIGYVGLRDYMGGDAIREITRWVMDHVQDPEQRAKVWLALARKYHARYMVTVDIPAEVWRRNPAVQVLYGQDKAVLLRIIATSLKEER